MNKNDKEWDKQLELMAKVYAEQDSKDYETRIEFYGIGNTIEILNRILDKYELEKEDIKLIVECIIMLDEQLNKHGNMKALLRVDNTKE